MNKDKIINKSEEFTKNISSRQSLKNKYFSVFYINSDKTLDGITVPKKVGKANVRNKLKRQVKNIIIQNEKDIQTNISYVIIIKEAAKELSYTSLEQELLNLLKKVRN